MPTVRSEAAVREFIERAGLVFEREGMPRMAGRVLGYLLVADESRQSIADLMAALGASNGSISTMTRLLVDQGYIDRIGVPGERRDYFSIRSGEWSKMLLAGREGITALRSLVEDAMELLPSPRHASRESLEEARDLFAFLEEELPALVARWEKRRGNKK